MQRPIVVGVDRSSTAEAAAQRAAELAADSGSPLHLVMAVDGVVSYEMVVGNDLFRIDSRADGEEFLRRVGRRFDHLAVTTEMAETSPSTALVEAAERLGARLIVVGNRQASGAGRVLGSVATDVLLRADCDVVVAHTTGQR